MRPTTQKAKKSCEMDRRRFIKLGGGAVAAVALTGAMPKAVAATKPNTDQAHFVRLRPR